MIREQPMGLTETGRYTIVGRYSYSGGGEGLWSGEITSKPAHFWVRALTVDEFQENMHVLETGSSDEVLVALDSLRIGATFDQYQDSLFQLLRTRDLPKARRAAALHLVRNPTVRLERQYISLLDDGDVHVAICAADALGSIGSQRAVPKLLALADPEKNPECYTGFVGPLLLIADARALPLLKRIARVNKGEWGKRCAVKAREMSKQLKAEYPSRPAADEGSAKLPDGHKTPNSTSHRRTAPYFGLILAGLLTLALLAAAARRFSLRTFK
jgi:hypothetical protein